MPREADNRLTATHHNATIGVTQLPPLSRQPFKRSFVPLCHPDSPQFNTLLEHPLAGSEDGSHVKKRSQVGQRITTHDQDVRVLAS